MAEIIGLKEKQMALKEISKKIKALSPLNDFLNAENASGEYTISFGNYSAPLLCKDPEQIKAFVRAYKATLVTEIRELAETYTIRFDEDEEALLR